MPRVLGCESFANKHMPEVCATPCTYNLCPHPIGIWNMFNGTSYLIIKTWPAAVRIEFVIRTIERRVALCANVCTFLLIVCILTGKRHLGPFVDDYTLLGGCQLI